MQLNYQPNLGYNFMQIVNFKYLVIFLLSVLNLSCTSNIENKTPSSFFTPNSDLYTSKEWYTSLRKAINDDPESVDNNLKLAQYFIDKNDWKSALEFASSAYHLDQEDKESMVLLADIYLQTQRYEDGIAIGEKAYQSGYRSLKLNLTLAELMIASGKLSAAQFYLNEVLTLIPNHPKSFYFKSLIVLSEKDTLKAISYLEKYIANEPAETVPFEILSNLYTSKNQTDLAIKAAKAGLKFGQANKLSYFLAKNYNKLKNADSTFKYSNLAIYDSTLAEALGFAGENFFKSKEYEKALRCFKKEEILSIKSDHLLWLAECYTKLGNILDAKEYYTKILEKDSLNLNALDGLKKLERGTSTSIRSINKVQRYLPKEEVNPDDSISQ